MSRETQERVNAVTQRTRVALLLIVVASAAALPGEAQSFANLKIGEAVPNPTLPLLAGGARRLFEVGAKVSVVMFFRAEQANSASVLKQMPETLVELSKRKVPVTLIASDHDPVDRVKAALATAKVEVPVLVDGGDALYGKVGVIVTPTAAIIDSAGHLLAYVAYKRVNFWRLVEAHVLHTLGEISDEALGKVIDPPRVTEGGNGPVARRYHAMALRFVELGKDDQALEMARRSLAAEDNAASRGLIAELLAKRGDCEGAQEEAALALKLDQKETRALRAREKCAAKPGSSP
ncbi:MAG: redoxin domain-containing protein [Deltaproteobacteria bacterium]|nr:redoxin domain-containing protein [Deltaproteobacteria bacterium]